MTKKPDDSGDEIDAVCRWWGWRQGEGPSSTATNLFESSLYKIKNSCLKKRKRNGQNGYEILREKKIWPSWAEVLQRNSNMVISRFKKANMQGTQSVQKSLVLWRPHCGHRRHCVDSLIARATRMARKWTNIQNPRAWRASVPSNSFLSTFPRLLTFQNLSALRRTRI